MLFLGGNVDRFEKLFTAYKHWLLGMKYYDALRALQFARGWHTGTRKDGVTPDLYHQVSIGMYLRTLNDSLLYPQETHTVNALHDVVEDHPPTVTQIVNMFGEQVGTSVRLMTKQKDGVKRAPEEVFAAMAEDAIASIDKGGDRIQNSQSMLGVFSLGKQKEYMDETRTLILPMLKKARNNFQRQHEAYQNIKFVLVSQLELLEAVHAEHDGGR